MERVRCISDNSLSGCRVRKNGIGFWTAGQRIDPNRESTFVWRVTFNDWSSDIAATISYTNWDTIEQGQPPQPDYLTHNPGKEACLEIMSNRSYTWNDYPCHQALCSVCEMDI